VVLPVHRPRVGRRRASIADGVIFGFATAAGPATQVVSPIFSLAAFLPVLAAGWRRMHDSGRPGWYLLIPLGVSVVMMLGLQNPLFRQTAVKLE
jgi:uncharacterized membrane protein YhaH (DUF805 family)